MKQATGWQDDGTYIPCPSCGYAPPPEPRRKLPGRVVHFPGTMHYGDCSTVPQLSAAAEKELREKLDEFDRCQARAWAEARNYVIY